MVSRSDGASEKERRGLTGAACHAIWRFGTLSVGLRVSRSEDAGRSRLKLLGYGQITMTWPRAATTITITDAARPDWELKLDVSEAKQSLPWRLMRFKAPRRTGSGAGAAAAQANGGGWGQKRSRSGSSHVSRRRARRAEGGCLRAEERATAPRGRALEGVCARAVDHPGRLQARPTTPCAADGQSVRAQRAAICHAAARLGASSHSTATLMRRKSMTRTIRSQSQPHRSNTFPSAVAVAA